MKRACQALAAVSSLGVVIQSIAVLAQTGSTAPQERPTFRTSVEYVEVDARVVDNRNTPVRGLKKEDFRLFEDGDEQTVVTFSAIDIPVQDDSARTAILTASGRRIEPDVSQNQVRAEESRVFVILLDDRQIDVHRTPRTIRIAKEFIERLGPRDLAAVVCSSGRTDVSQTLTTNKTLLLQAIDGFMGRKLESGIILAHNRMKPLTYEAEQAFEARGSLRALTSVVTWMSGIQGRSKVLLLFSEGLDYDIELSLDRAGNSDPLPLEEREALAAATRGNVTIHTIDPRGLYTYDELTSLGGGGVGSPGGAASLNAASQTARAFRAEVLRGQMQLRSVAAETGGTPIVESNDFDGGFDRIIMQQSTYYLLGYYPKNKRQDGKVRKIDVRVAGRGLRVVARRNYREAERDAPASAVSPGPSGASVDLREALNSPLPVAGLALTATAAAFRAADRSATIAVITEAAPGGIEIGQKDGKFTGAVEMTTVAVDQRNAVVASESITTTLQLAPGMADQLQEGGFRALSRLANLRPGRYQIRVVMQLAGTPKLGSVWYDIDIPDFSKGDLALSGVVVASAYHGQTVTGNASKLFTGGLLMIPPTAVREFKSDDGLMVFAEIYANLQEIEANVTVTIKDERGTVLTERKETISAADFREADGAYQSLTRLPLDNLLPGAYVLTVEASRPQGTVPVAVRAAPFRVIP